MNTFEENINGHDCGFEISGNNQNTQFTGKAEIKDPCISQKLFFSLEHNKYSTENSVKEYLRDQVKEYLTNPFYLHPMVNSQPQPIGSTCVSCKRIISSNDGWQGIR